MAKGDEIYTQDRDGNVYRMLPAEEVIDEGEQRAVRRSGQQPPDLPDTSDLYEVSGHCPNCPLFIEAIATLSAIIKENQGAF